MLDTFVINEIPNGSLLDQTPAAGRSLVKCRGIQDRLHLAFPDGLNGLPGLPGNLGHQNPWLPPVPRGGQCHPSLLGH